MKKRSTSNKIIIVGKEKTFMEWETIFLVGVIANCSDTTRLMLRRYLGNIGKTMESYGLTSIWQLEQHHIKRFFDGLGDRKLSGSSRAAYAVAMRRLCRTLGKSHLVPTNKNLGIVTVKP